MLLRINTFIITTLLLCSCGGDNHSGHAHDDAREKELHSTHESGEVDNHDDEIILSPEAARKFGVKTEPLRRRPFSDVIKVGGMVEPSPGSSVTVVARSAGTVTLDRNLAIGKSITAGASLGTVSATGITGGDQDKVAALKLEAARKEYERVVPLYNDGIVSKKDYNAAMAAYEEAKAAYSGRSTGGSLSAPAGGVLTELLVKQGDYVNVGQPVAVISKTSRLFLRADVPQRYSSMLPKITSANFRTAYSDTVMSLSDMSGHRESAVSQVAVQPGYLPLYFSFDNDGSVVAGSNAEIYLLTAPGDSLPVIPVVALTEQQGALFAYVRTGDHGYDKRAVKTGVSNGRYVEIVSGLDEGEEVVTEGVIFIRLAETAGVAPEGHSHNH